MRFIDRLRLARGLHWNGKYPPLPWKQIVIVVSVGVVVSLAENLDYYIARADAAEQAAEIFEAHALALRNCERGATGYYYPDGRAFECPKKL